jgi:hypothetical protein
MSGGHLLDRRSRVKIFEETRMSPVMLTENCSFFPSAALLKRSHFFRASIGQSDRFGSFILIVSARSLICSLFSSNR